MKFFRNLKKSTLSIWAVLLSVAIIIAQGVKLHVHDFDHEHGKSDSQIHTVTVDEHSHVHATHVANYNSHSDSGDHDPITSEMDATPNGLSGKIFNLLILIAAFITGFFLLKANITQYLFRYRPETISHIVWRFHLSPPLRAPPL